MSKFWAKNYIYNTSDTQKLNHQEVYALFKLLYPDTRADLANFIQRAGSIGVKYKKRKKCFFTTPMNEMMKYK